MDDLSEHFKIWKQGETEIAQKRRILQKRRNNKQKQKLKKRIKKLDESTVKPAKLEPLSNEFLEELTANESPSNDKKKSKGVKKDKKRLKLTSSLIDNADFIPLEVNVASTDFKLVRLNRCSESDALAKNALEFFNRRLHGKHIRREPTKALFAGAEKLKAKRSLCVKR